MKTSLHRGVWAATLTFAVGVASGTVSSTAQAQGLPGGFAPERGVRLPSRLPEAGVMDGEAERDRARPYRDGQLVPPGHEVITTFHGPLLGAGTALFGFHWVLGLVLSQVDFRLDGSDAARPEARNNPLMVPLVGPFIALGTDDARPAAETAVLVLDGVAQIGSLGMIALGITLRQKWLVRIQPTGADLAISF